MRLYIYIIYISTMYLDVPATNIKNMCLIKYICNYVTVYSYLIYCLNLINPIILTWRFVIIFFRLSLIFFSFIRSSRFMIYLHISIATRLSREQFYISSYQRHYRMSTETFTLQDNKNVPVHIKPATSRALTDTL